MKSNYHPEEQRKWRQRIAKSDRAAELIAMERAIAQRNDAELLAELRKGDERQYGE